MATAPGAEHWNTNIHDIKNNKNLPFNNDNTVSLSECQSQQVSVEQMLAFVTRQCDTLGSCDIPSVFGAN